MLRLLAGPQIGILSAIFAIGYYCLAFYSGDSVVIILRDAVGVIAVR